MQTVKISKTNSSISIYYFTRACSAILLLRKYPSIALRQSRHDCSCCVNVNGKILKIIFLIISILSGSSGSLFPTLWSVIRVKFRKQIMLWCLIFHSAELQNYVPALHGIMFGSFNFNKKCNKLCSALLELCWEYFTYN